MVFPVLNDALDLLAARRKGVVLSIVPVAERQIETKYAFDGLEFVLESLPRPGLLTLAETMPLSLPKCTHCLGPVGQCVLPCPTQYDSVVGEPLTTMILPSPGSHPRGTACVIRSAEEDYYARGREASKDGPLCIIHYSSFVQLYHQCHETNGSPVGRFDVFNHDGIVATNMQDIATRPVVVPVKWREEIAAIDAYLVI